MKLILQQFSHSLKGQCHKISEPRFIFHHPIPSRVLIHIMLRIRRAFRKPPLHLRFFRMYMYVMFAYIPTVFVFAKNFLKRGMRSDRRLREGFGGVIKVSAWSQWDRGNRFNAFRSLIETAESASAVIIGDRGRRSFHIEYLSANSKPFSEWRQPVNYRTLGRIVIFFFKPRVKNLVYFQPIHSEAKSLDWKICVWQIPVFRYGLLRRNRGYIEFETR
jgi:hypothetical protein